MAVFTKKISIRWSDLDPNFHLRHSAYYDFGAQHRMELLTELGLTALEMHKQHFGPILFKEECIFKREIHFGDKIFITTKMSKMKKDASRWSITHELIDEEGNVKAKITVDGAWMDTKLRKICNPTPQIAMDALETIPKSDDFILLD